MICVIQILSVISDIGKLIQINLVVGDIENIQNWFWRIFSLETELWEKVDSFLRNQILVLLIYNL